MLATLMTRKKYNPIKVYKSPENIVTYTKNMSIKQGGKFMKRENNNSEKKVSKKRKC